MSSRSGLVGGQGGLVGGLVFKVNVIWRSVLIRGHIFKVKTIWGHVFKVRFGWRSGRSCWRSCLQGQDYLEVMSLRSMLIRGHIFKVETIWGSCLQGQVWLEVREVLSSRLRLFRGRVFKVNVD